MYSGSTLGLCWIYFGLSCVYFGFRLGPPWVYPGCTLGLPRSTQVYHEFTLGVVWVYPRFTLGKKLVYLTFPYNPWFTFGISLVYLRSSFVYPWSTAA